jgi:hypothetical protein
VPLLVVGVAVKLLTLKVEVDRETVCVIAAVLLGAKTKLSEFGFAEMGLETPPEFAFSVTGIERFVAAERTLINPTLTPDVRRAGCDRHRKNQGSGARLRRNCQPALLRISRGRYGHRSAGGREQNSLDWRSYACLGIERKLRWRGDYGVGLSVRCVKTTQCRGK